jgi:hypothetical protein
MFQPTHDHRDRRLTSYLRVSAPEIVAIVAGAAVSVALLGVIVLVKGGQDLGSLTAVNTSSQAARYEASRGSATLAPPQPGSAAHETAAPGSASPSAKPTLHATAAASSKAGAEPAQPMVKSSGAPHVPRQRPVHAQAAPPSEVAKSTFHAASSPASQSHAIRAPTAKPASAPPVAKPAANTAAPTSKAESGKAVQAGAAPAKASRPAPTGPVRVIIDYESAAPGMADMASALAKKLRAAGYKPVEIRPVDFIVSANQVRFFFASDHDAAKRITGLAGEVKGAGGAERRFAVSDFTDLKQKPPDNLVEIWLRSW